jgi:hypothetical protein
MNQFTAGDRVIYRREKSSTHPGPRARNIDPAPLGELYSYEVDKFWTVKEVQNGSLVLVTRRGKRHTVKSDDPRLRRANWWERLIFSGKFPTIAAGPIGL